MFTHFLLYKEGFKGVKIIKACFRDEGPCCAGKQTGSLKKKKKKKKKKNASFIKMAENLRSRFSPRKYAIFTSFTSFILPQQNSAP